MSKLLLKEYGSFEQKEKQYDDTGKRIFPKSKYGNNLVKGILQRCDTLNQNGRVYPRHILEREVENYNKLIRERRAAGELDHADQPVVEWKNTSHIITELWWEGDALHGQVEVLGDMDQGRQLKVLLENDIKVGISSRALGSVKKVGESNIVQEDLQLICWDFVSEPSTPGAFMTESKLYSDDVLNKVFTKSDRIDRALNEILSLKGSRKVL